MVQIIPAVLATSEQQYQNDISKLSSSESLNGGWVHIDFMDNIFVQNKSIDPEVVSKFPDNFQKEAHLMVAHPKDWVDKLVKAGFKRIIFHIEVEDDILEVIEYIKSKGIEVGIALKNETPIEKLSPFISKIDVILIMGIGEPGFQGQPFIPETLDRISEVKRNNWQVRIGVDGAVSDIDVKEVVASGVDFMIVGSFLLKGDTEENLENLWEIING